MTVPPLRVLIVDDEAPARHRLAMLVEEIGGALAVVGEAASGLEALDLTTRLRPDVLLLDVAMPEVDGFDVLRHLEPPRPVVILQSAYHEHALRAFEYEALDYLVKPVAIDRLSRALDRARTHVALRASPARLPVAALREIRHRLGHQPIRPARLLVRFGQGHRLIATRDIVCFVAESGMVYAETVAGRFGTDYTVSELDDRMRGTFVRVSRGHLINPAMIETIVSNGDGSATVTVAGRAVHVSRRRAVGVRTALER